MMDNESDPQSGLSTGQPSDAATPDKPERDQRAELGEATVRDLSNLLIALRSLIAGSESRGKSSSRNRNAKAMARGDYIRRTRIAQNMTRYALAAKIGESQQLIVRIEYGEVTHSKALPKVLAALGIRPDTQWAETADADGPSSIEGVSSSVPTDVQIEPPEAKMKQNPIQVRLDPDYECFAAELLRIRTKGGALVPLVFNRAQRHIHQQLEAQKATTGKVRALILKGRQQGCSTYVGGRYYHRAIGTAGLRVFILSHEDQATKNLFEMVERFHDQMDERIKPSTGVANASEFYFDELDSGYKVGTAGNKGVGRSATLQLLHGSEVAFWPFAAAHAAGVLQAVAEETGTEIILESTANGVGNVFHKMWRDAEAGAGNYIAIFVPWFWQDEYRQQPGEGFMLDAEEAEYAALYGLDVEQMAWRRGKIAELNDPMLFKQEYPATAAEAFQMSGHDSFIPPELIAKARKARCEPSGPLVIGYDPAWKGKDRHAMAWRRGRVVIKVETRMKLDTVEAAGWVKSVIDREKPAKVFIDVGGPGPGVFDQLKHMGPPYSHIVEAVNFGSSPVEPPPLDELGRPSGGPLNRRAEMWMKSKAWLEEPGGAQVPDSDSLQADACGPSYRYDALTRIVLESKEDMRRRGALSPDEWDAVALTFARPVAPSNFNRRIVYPPSGLV